jgi:sugar lactone lactonase YvrE
MRATPVNLIGGFYADDTRPWSVQDTVNWLPVAAEVDGTLTPSKLSTPPGLRPYQKIGTGTIRGMYNCEGQMFVVSGRTMYRISNSGVGIPVGTIPGVGRVSISHNQFKGGNQVLVTNGSPGGGYVYDTQTQVFNRISDPGFPGSLMTAYVDSYLLGVEPQGRFWFHSNLADANDYNTLDRYEAEAAPDRIVGLAVSQFEVWTFGERTTECFGNTGGATGTFQSRRTSIERGCASRWTVQNLDNSIFWLGDDGIVYRLEGYGARRVSTVPLERAIASNRLQDAFAFTWEDKGHKVYYLTMPDGNTWGYDVVSGVWHRRESYGLNRWRLNDAVRWNGAWYGGDFQDGRIWQLDWEYPAEGDQPMVSERTSPVMHDAQSAFNLTSVELIVGVGQQAVAMSGEFPEQPPRPEISGQAPDGVKGIPFEYTYTASGGTGALTFSISSGRLPSGVSLSSAGVLTGSPAMSGSYTFTVRVTDSAGMWAEVVDVVRVLGGVVALATDAFLFERAGADLVETVTVGFDVLARGLAISPNGALIACGSSVGAKLRVGIIKADRSGYVEIPVDLLPANGVQGVDFHPSGGWLLAAEPSANLIHIYQCSPEAVTRAGTFTLNQASGPRFSRNGEQVVCGTGIDAPSYGLAVMSFDAETGQIGQAVHPPVSGGVFQGSPYSEFSPSGEFIATDNNNGTAVWRFSAGGMSLIAGTYASGRGVHWSPDGRYLYTVTATGVGGNRVIAYEWNGSSLSSPVYPSDQPSSVTISDSSLSSDGKQLVIGLGGSNPGQALYVYNVNGTELTLAERPVTSNANASAVRWTGVPLD